jgi:DNA-binding transcriptional regulator YiaG
MPNIGTVLKEEIGRLSRKEIRSQVDPIKKVTTQQRKEIAALKRQVAQLERQIALLTRKVLSTRPAAVSATNAKSVRFSAKQLRTQRTRLGLSALDFGKVLGVSAQTIYSWEAEKSRPRNEQLAKLAAIRGIGKREAGKRLKQLGAPGGKVRGNA